MEFNGIWRFIIVFIRTRQSYPPWARWIQSMTSHPNPSRFTLVPSFHLCLDLPHVLLQVSPPEPSAFLFFPIRATCLAQLNILDSITLILFGESNREVITMELPVLNVLLDNKHCKEFNKWKVFFIVISVGQDKWKSVFCQCSVGQRSKCHVTCS